MLSCGCYEYALAIAVGVFLCEMNDMPNQSGSEKRRMEMAVTVRMPEDLAVHCRDVAERAKLSVASWLRALAVEATTNIEVHRRPSKPRPQLPPAPPGIILELAGLREVVAELGGALVQSAIAAREGGRLADHAEIEAVIPKVKRAVVDLDRLKEKLWPPA
jgi:hypothetical protein